MSGQPAPPIGKCLSGNALKMIAIVAMTTDHLAWLFFPKFPLDALPVSMHIIGRLTAPIMMFFIAEGYHYTRDRNKYLKRLLIFAVISHVPYTMMFPQFVVIPGIPTTSVIWPFAMGLLALMIDRKDLLPNVKAWQRTVLVWVCFIVALPSDWSMPAAIAIFLMGRAHGDFKRQMLALVGPLATYAVACACLFSPAYGLHQIAIVLAIPLLAAYSGKRGTMGGKAMKWLFYIYYPAHLLILGSIRIFILHT